MADPPLHRRPLLKHRSWSPDTEREEAWERRRDLYRIRRSCSSSARSLTDDDFDELRGCIDLGILSGDGSLQGGDCANRIAKILPALDLYLAIIQRGSSGSESQAGSPLSIFSSGSTPSEIKANLKQWAQVVACSLHQRY